MIRSTLLLAALLAGAAGGAASAGARDARLVSRLYNAEEVVRIEGRAGVQATIAFADDEHIENVAVGNSTTWQITPNKRANLLFVKPLAPRARTNMTVVTDRRSYYFDLVAEATGNPLYVLRFTYPDAPASDRATAAAQLVTETEAQAASTAQEIAPAAQPDPAQPDPARLNFAWSAKGKERLVPARIYDDGAATFVAWAAGSPIPAILVRNDKGEEGPVNFAVRGDVIVIDGVPGLIVLRAGRDSASLENKGPPRKSEPAAALAAAAPQASPKGE